MFQNSRVITFRFDGKLNRMTDVSVTFRPPCSCPSEGHQHGVAIQSSTNSNNKAQMNNRMDLNHGKVVCISSFITASRFILLNGYDSVTQP